MVSKCLLRTNPRPGTMGEAREHLYEKYQVRFVTQPNAPIGAPFEIYAALELKTRYNSFEEH